MLCIIIYLENSQENTNAKHYQEVEVRIKITNATQEINCQEVSCDIYKHH